MVFGTIWRNRDSENLYVLVLYRNAFTGEWNLNYNWLDNDFNSDYRAVGRSCYYLCSPALWAGVSFATFFSQPPSMRPISSKGSDRARYFLLSKALISQAMRAKNLSTSNLRKACLSKFSFFDKVFISHSYSCRLNKGTHKALNCFKKFSGKASCNNTKTCLVLKCDIKKFFASIDQSILISIFSQYIPQKDILWLIQEIVHSFYSTAPGTGLPLGNLTSQLLVNIYLNEFDQFVKHGLKAKYYLRYADDIVVLSTNKEWLEGLINPIADFLQSRLRLSLHPQKVSIQTLSSGVDFLGWVHFPDHRVLRTTTKKRMFKKIGFNPKPASIASYLGLLKYGNAYKLKRQLLEMTSNF